MTATFSSEAVWKKYATNNNAKHLTKISHYACHARDTKSFAFSLSPKRSHSLYYLCDDSDYESDGSYYTNDDTDDDTDHDTDDDTDDDIDDATDDETFQNGHDDDLPESELCSLTDVCDLCMAANATVYAITYRASYRHGHNTSYHGLEMKMKTRVVPNYLGYEVGIVSDNYISRISVCLKCRKLFMMDKCVKTTLFAHKLDKSCYSMIDDGSSYSMIV